MKGSTNEEKINPNDQISINKLRQCWRIYPELEKNNNTLQDFDINNNTSECITERSASLKIHRSYVGALL